MDRCIQGGIPLHETYMRDTQEKTDHRDTNHRDTNRILLSHGKLSAFRVSRTARTFSGTLRVDPLWDGIEDLVEIARGKIKEAEGARERLDMIKNLSVHCDISPRILYSPSEAQNGYCAQTLEFLVGTFASWLCLASDGPVLEGLSVCGNTITRISKIPCRHQVAEIRLDKPHDWACPLWIEMLAQGELGRNNVGRTAAAARPGRLPHRWGPRQAIKHILLARTGAYSCYAVNASRGASSRRVPDSGGLRGWHAKIRRHGRGEASTSRSSSVSGQVSKCRSLPNSRFPKI